MRKHLKTIQFISFLSAFSIATSLSNYCCHSINSKDISYVEITPYNLSYNGETKEMNSNWYIVKIYSEERIVAQEIFISLCYQTPPTARWGTTGRFFIINFDTGDYWSPPIVSMWHHYDLLDFYLQIHIGKFNFTFEHLTEKSGADINFIWDVRNLTLPPGTWYLITMAAPTQQCHISLYINGTNALIVNESEGPSSFIYESEDFNSIINLKSSFLSGMFGAEKRFYINNTFIGFIYAPTGIGIAYSKYRTPTGEEKTALSWNIFKKFYVSKRSQFIPVFEPIFGESGTWTFYENFISIGISTVDIFGADVILP